MLRHDFIATTEDSLLLIVDFQENLLKVMEGWQELAQRMTQLAQAAALMQIPVVVTEQYKKGLGATHAPLLAAIDAPLVLDKEHFSACLEPDFLPALHGLGRKKIIVVGMEAHVCVLQTCLDLLQAGFQVHLVTDAVSSRTAANCQAGIELMRQAGVLISTTETVIFQWTCRANTELFRQVLPIVK